MLAHGSAPFLECSTRGDKRFSAFCARIKGRENRTIESIYQAAKEFVVASIDADMFGQPGHCCQATELFRIKNEGNEFFVRMSEKEPTVKFKYTDESSRQISEVTFPSMYSDMKGPVSEPFVGTIDECLEKMTNNN